MDPLVSPFGTFPLRRYPASPADPLRAWDAADELLLLCVAETHPRGMTGHTVVVNDNWGALTTALTGDVERLTSITDSFLARRAVLANVAICRRPTEGLAYQTSFDPVEAPIDMLLLKVPKDLGLLEDLLHRLGPRLHARSTVLAAGMTRHIHRSTLELFTRLVGPTTTSLARKKARLIHSVVDPLLERPSNPWPNAVTVAVPGRNEPVTTTNHAGVFSSHRLDLGTRLLLTTLDGLVSGRPPEPNQPPTQVIDLGCGNGVVGTAYALLQPACGVTFIDEAYRAVASAEATFRATSADGHSGRFVWGNGIADLDDSPEIGAGTVDLVLNNPPFHADHAVDTATAMRMFSDAHDALRPGGELVVVGNRHLGHHTRLQRLFGNHEVLAANPRFVVLRAIRSDVSVGDPRS